MLLHSSVMAYAVPQESAVTVIPTNESVVGPIELSTSNLNDTSEYPWGEIAQSVQKAIDSGENEISALNRIAPAYVESLNRESNYDRFKCLWGKSINFDELAKNEILPSTLIDALGVIFKVPNRDELVVHAGLEHTYGYLLSILLTKYGYKRDRWVKPDIEYGFGLNQGDISPFPKNGGLFSNVTYFAGSIAFRNDSNAIRILKNPFHHRGVSPSLKKFDFKKLKISRLTETVILNNGRKVELRADFIPFLYKNPISHNDAIVVYSVKDSTTHLPYLITTFPILLSTMLPSKPSLGDHQPITTRWNAFIPGITNSKTPLFGTRTFQ